MNTAGYLKFETKMDTNGFQKGINDITSKTKRGGGTIKNIVAGLGIAKIASIGINAIKSSLDGAISRFDTLKNFPKVMQSLGYSADQASASMKKLDKGIEGLPTTMDEIVKNTQLLTASLGDLDKGTETAVALNDLFLAGGQGAEAASRGLQQYNQMLAKGKVDQQSWNTLIEVAPGQINQVAKSLLGANANQRDLYAALQNGTISMKEFNDKIIELDEKGGKGFASFHDQALEATGGIGTAITNLKTAVTKGTTGLIEALDNALKDAGFGSVASYINKFGSKIKEGFKQVAEFIQPILTDLLSGKMSFQEAGNKIGDKVGNLISKATTELMKRLPNIINSLIKFLIGAAEGLAPYIPEIIKTLVEGAMQTLISIINNFDEFYKMAFTITNQILNGLDDSISIIINALPDLIASIVDGFIRSLPLFIAAGYMIPIKLLLGILKGLPRLWKELPFIAIKILGVFIQLVRDIVTKVKEIGPKILNIFLKIPKNIKKAFDEGGIKGVGKYLVEGLWNGIKAAKDWVVKKVKGFGKDILKSLKDAVKEKSPSKATFEMGVNLDKGMILGIENSRKAVLKTASQLGNDVINRMQSAVALETGNINASANLRANANWNNVMVANIQVESDMYMDKTKVGQAVTPVVSRTLKKAGV